MAKVENLNIPMGWLIDPHNKWGIHFEQKEDKSKQVKEDFTIDMWGLDKNGKPEKFKSRRKATKKDSLKTWNQLISSDWTQFNFEKLKSA